MTALLGSQEPRQQPCLPPADLGLGLGQVTVALGSKVTRWSAGCVLFPYPEEVILSWLCVRAYACLCVRVRERVCGLFTISICAAFKAHLPPLCPRVGPPTPCTGAGADSLLYRLPHMWPSLRRAGCTMGWVPHRCSFMIYG